MDILAVEKMITVFLYPGQYTSAEFTSAATETLPQVEQALSAERVRGNDSLLRLIWCIRKVLGKYNGGPIRLTKEWWRIFEAIKDRGFDYACAYRRIQHRRGEQDDSARFQAFTCANALRELAALLLDDPVMREGRGRSLEHWVTIATQGVNFDGAVDYLSDPPFYCPPLETGVRGWRVGLPRTLPV